MWYLKEAWEGIAIAPSVSAYWFAKTVFRFVTGSGACKASHGIALWSKESTGIGRDAEGRGLGDNDTTACVSAWKYCVTECHIAIADHELYLHHRALLLREHQGTTIVLIGMPCAHLDTWQCVGAGELLLANLGGVPSEVDGIVAHIGLHSQGRGCYCHLAIVKDRIHRAALLHLKVHNNMTIGTACYRLSPHCHHPHKSEA